MASIMFGDLIRSLIVLFRFESRLTTLSGRGGGATSATPRDLGKPSERGSSMILHTILKSSVPCAANIIRSWRAAETSLVKRSYWLAEFFLAITYQVNFKLPSALEITATK